MESKTFATNSASSSSTSTSPVGRFYRKYLSPGRSTEEKRSTSSMEPENFATNAEEKHLRSLSDINIAQKSNELERVFNYFDENGDGKISPSELQKRVRVAGGELSDEEAEMAVRSSDADGDGLLGMEDFVKLMKACGTEEERRDELKSAFDMYVMEGRNVITPNSLKKMLSKLGEKTTMEKCEVMIRKYDLNGDGVLNFDEFSIMMGLGNV